MIIHRVQILHVLIHENPYDLEVAIGPIREARFMERRPPELVLGLQTGILEGILQQFNKMHGQRHAGHPRLDGYTVTFFRFQIPPVRIGI